MNLDLNILKAISTNKTLAQEFVYECNSNLFDIEYWAFAQSLIKYIQSYKDIPTLRVLKEKNSKNEKLCETIDKVWSKLEKINYDEKEFKHDLNLLKTRFANTQLSSLREKLNNSEDLYSNLDLIKHTLNNVSGINRKKSFTKKTLKDSVSSFMEKYNAKLEARKNGLDVLEGIPTKYSALDDYTGGLRDGEFLLICGESNSGKSMLLMNIALQMWMQNNTIDSVNFTEGNNVLYFSLEMPFDMCFNRVLAKLADVPSKKIKSATLSSEEKNRVKKALDFIKRFPFQFEIIDIPRGVTIEVIENIFEETKTNFKPKVVGIDYLGLMDLENSGNMDDWLKLGYISEKVHEFGRVHEVIMLSAVQLNRVKPTKDTDEKIGMHRIGRSSLIVTNANIAVQIHTRQNESQYPDMEYFVIKNRDGQLGKGQLIKKLECGSLIDSKLENEFTEIGDLSSYMEDLQGFGDI